MFSTLNATNYQQVRLWSGIFSIGANLGLIWALYFASLSASPWLLSRFDARVLLLLPVAAMLALGFVFDLLCGHTMESALGRTRQSLKGWLRDWLLVALRVAPALYVGLLSLGWLRFQPTSNQLLFAVFAALFLIFLTLLLPAFLPRSWRCESDQTRDFAVQLRPELAKIGVPSGLAILWIESEDETTVNGAIPPLGRAQIWLGTNVARELSPRQAALLIRRDWWFRRTKKHVLSAAICVSWLLFGFLFARFLPARDALQAAFGGAAIVTSWCFVALFVWPRLDERCRPRSAPSCATRRNRSLAPTLGAN